MESFLERSLLPYLAHDLEAWKKGVEDESPRLCNFCLAARDEVVLGAVT